ncbi:hypothetical protein CRG98_030724 [Punica granatum]|uniref:Uncharacterized protein n=1 Tax=Punica granatum TaxID=22663 RepID=A0A2I0IZM8_PUNGR|nr:hypothetical protein CRG98_030724 [Punica granatum]
MDAKSWTRSPKGGKDGREVRKAVKMDVKSWTRSPKSGKDGHEVRKAVKMDMKFKKRSPRGVFDLAGSILLSLEFARAKGLKDSTSECVAFCLHRGVASAAPLLSGFVDFFLELAVSEF